jgi:hypothetical protein
MFNFNIKDFLGTSFMHKASIVVPIIATQIACTFIATRYIAYKIHYTQIKNTRHFDDRYDQLTINMITFLEMLSEGLDMLEGKKCLYTVENKRIIKPSDISPITFTGVNSL